MKKGKSITLLSIICALMVLLIAATFVRFPMGVKDFNSILGSVETDYDLSGGAAYTLTLADDNINKIDEIDDVVCAIENRLEKLGYSTYSIKALRAEGEVEENYSLRIEARPPVNESGVLDYSVLDADIAVATRYGQLRFFGNSEANPTEEHEILSDMAVIEDASYSLIEGQYVVSITFTEEAYREIVSKMSTSAYYLKITLGDTVLEPFDGQSASLSLNSFERTIAVYTYAEAAAKQLELQLTSGGIDYKYNEPVRIEEVTTFLGANAEMVSVIAIAVIVLVSIAALIVLYRGFGIASALSLVLFILLDVFMLVAIPGIKVSLGGVVAIILSTLMCVDGMVIIGSRIKEAGKTGKTVKASINAGFNGSLIPIINISVISLIVGLLFFALASGPLYNFAVIITIGAVLSAITNLLFIRMFVTLFLPIVKNKEKFFNVNAVEV